MHPILDPSSLILKQRFEPAELIGLETRNKYEICAEDGRILGFCAEQQKGILGFLSRQYLGHWRAFEVVVYDETRKPVWKATHPFRWYFQRFEIEAADGTRLGALQQRWGLFQKIFDIEGPLGKVVLRMESGFFSFWTFPILRQGREVARIEKKWSGILNEMFTDADIFRVILGQELSELERVLVLLASVFVDLQFFEEKAKSPQWKLFVDN